MPIPQQTSSFLNKARQTGPSRYNMFNDEQLYSILSRKNQIPESAIWKERDKEIRKSQGLSARPQQDLGFFAGSADWFINEDSYEWMKAGYNRSLGGMTEQLIAGDQRYNVDEEDFTLLQDIGASLVSFLMPLDLLTLGAGSLAGKAAAGAAVKNGLFGNALKEASKAGVKKELTGEAAKDISQQAIAKVLSNSKVKSALIGATRQAPALALYEGAVGGVQARINGEDAFPAIAKGVFHGGVMGALTGGIGGGMGAKQAQILAQTKGNPIGLDKIRAYGIYGMPGQIAAESSVFSASELGHKLASGEDLDADSILRTFARNIGLFSGLKLVHKGLGKGIEKGSKTGTEYWNKGKQFWKDTEAEYVKRKKAEKDAMDGLEKTVNEKTNGEGLAEVAAQKAGFDVEIAETQGRLKELGKDANDIFKAFESKDARKIEDNPILIRKLNNSLEAIKQELEGKSNKTAAQKQLLSETTKLKEWINGEFKKYGWVDGPVKPAKAPVKEKPIEKIPQKISKEQDLIDKIAAERRVSAEEVRADKSLQKPLRGPKNEILMDIGKLEKAYADILETRPNTPASNLAKSLTDTSIEVLKEKPDFKRKIKGVGPIKDYIDGLKLNPKNEKMLYLGFSEFFPTRASNKGPVNYKMMADYAKWLESKDKNVNEASRETTDAYIKAMKKKGQFTTLQERNTLNNTLSNFYGTGGTGLQKITTGFSYKYMGKDASDNPAVSQLGILRETKAAAPEKIGLVVPKDYKTIQGIKDSLVKEGKPLKGKGKQEVAPEVYDAATEMMYEFGSRGQDTLNRLYIQNIDWKNGIIKEWSTGYKHKGAGPRVDIPLKKIIPSLWKKLVKVKGDRDSGVLFLDTKGKTLTRDSINKINESITPKGINLRGKKGKFTVQDFRKMATTDAGKMNKEIIDFVDKYLVGHKGTMRERYNIQEVNKLWKQFREQRTKLEYGEVPAKKSPATKRQLAELKEKLEATQELVETQKQFFEKIPAYKNIKILTNQKLGKVKGERVLGQITGHTVKIAEGKVRPDTLPHEISHYAVDVLRKFGTKKDMDLIKRGEKMFKSEEKLVQAIGEYAQGKLKNKTLISKVKTWIKSFNARLKDMLGIATKADVAYLLSRKVVEGNIPLNRRVKNFVNQLETHYQTDSKVIQVEYGKIGKPFEKEILDKPSTYGMKKADMDALRESYNIPKEGTQKGWIKEGRVSLGQVKQWVDELFEIKSSKKKKSSILEDLNKEYNIDAITSSNIAKSLGSLDGTLQSLTPKNIQNYKHVVKTGGKKAPIRFNTIDTIEGTKGNVTLHQKLINGFLPVYEVLKKFGMNKIGNLGFKVETDVNLLKGPGRELVHQMKEILKPSYGKNKQNKYYFYFDTQRAKKYIKDSKNPKKEHIKEIPKDEIQFFENIQKPGTRENQAKMIYDKLRKFYWEELKNSVRKVKNKAEFEIFLKEFNEKYVNDYFTRRPTAEAYKYLIESGAVEGFVNKQIAVKASRQARKQASKKYKKGTEQHDALYEKLKEEYKVAFEPEVYKDAMFASRKDNPIMRNKFLLERGPLLDEFIKIKVDGKTKIIRTYETHLQKTITPYSEGMAKHIAAVRHFPEFTDMGGSFVQGKSAEVIAKYGLKDSYKQAYAVKAIERLLGVEQGEPLKRVPEQALGMIAHVSAAIGLSSPTSGIKNILIGMPRNVATFGLMNTMRGMAKTIYNPKRAWKEAREKGVLNYAPETLELGKTPGSIMEKLFKFNLMTSTENMNRIVAMEAGKLFFQTKLSVLRNQPGIFSAFKKRDARRMMRDVWQIPKKDRLMLETADLNLPKNQERLESIVKHIEQMSHFSTQGGTSPWRLPLATSSKLIKPLTLFQRIAYATTQDTVKNYFKPALQYGNFAPIARATLGHYFGGMALYGMYKYLFQTEPPKSAGTELDKMSMYLWRSEALGLFGEAISPYDKGNFQMISAPVINRNAVEAGKNLWKWISGDQSLSKFIDNTALATVVLYNQYDTMKKTTLSKEYADARKINNWERQFYIDRRGEFKMSSEQEFSRRQVYYKDLKEAIYIGNEEKIAKAYYAAYNFIISELERMEGKTTLARKHKEAKKALNSSLRAMEPGNLSAETPKGVILSKKADFLKFIQEKFGNKGSYEFRQAVKDYKKLKASYERVINNRKYWNKYSVYSSANLK